MLTCLPHMPFQGASLLTCPPIHMPFQSADLPTSLQQYAIKKCRPSYMSATHAFPKCQPIYTTCIFKVPACRPAHQYICIHVIFSWTQIGRFGFSNREIGSQIGRFFRSKNYSILVSKIVICSTVDHCKMFYLPVYC